MWRCCLISGGAVGQFLAEDYYVVHQTYDTGSTTTMTDLIITCCTYWVYYLLKNGMELSNEEWGGCILHVVGVGAVRRSCCGSQYDTTRHDT